MYSLIVINFRVSIFVLIIGYSVIFYSIQAGYPESLAHIYRFKMATFAAPLIFIALSVYNLFVHYRHGRGHVEAFWIGFVLLAMAIGVAVSEAENGSFYSDWGENFRWYVGASHLVYGLTDLNSVVKDMGRDAR